MLHKEYAIIRVLNKVAEWSFYLAIFVMPFSKSLLEALFVVALISVAAKKLMLREPLFKRRTVNLALALFVIASLPSFFNTGYMSLSLRALFSKLIKFALWFILAQEALDTEDAVKNFSIMAFLSCIVVLIDGFIQYFVTHVDILHLYPSFQYCAACITTYKTAFSPYDTTFLGFPTASFPFPNDFASWILIMIFPVLIYAFTAGRRLRGRLASALVFACLFYFLILTKTRSAWAGFLISLMAIPFFNFSKTKKIIAALLVLIVVVSPFIMKKDIRASVLSLSSIVDRNTMWQNGWKIFKQHPIIGNGINTFYVNYMKIRQDEYKNKHGSYAHNCYLQMASETGLVGLAGFLCFLTILILTAARSVKRLRRPFQRSLQMGLLLGLVAFLVQAFMDTNLYSLNLSVLFWISAGLAARMTEEAGSENR